MIILMNIYFLNWHKIISINKLCVVVTCNKFSDLPISIITLIASKNNMNAIGSHLVLLEIQCRIMV